MTQFEFKKTILKDAMLITNFSVGDNRGGFSKCFEYTIFQNNEVPFHVDETFFSISSKNVLRGMHFQTYNPQAKIVCVPKGKVYDVIVDLRRESPSYKKWEGFELSDKNHNALYIPRGFAHGFLSLADDTIMLYQCDGFYNKGTDSGIKFDDLDIGIKWPLELVGGRNNLIISEKDLNAMSFADYKSYVKKLNEKEV